MYQALYGMAPSNVMLSSFTAQAAVDPTTFARSLVAPFANTSSSALAKTVLKNLNITPATVNVASYDLLLDAVGQIFDAYGLNARGQIILNLTNLLANLESDVTYGQAAQQYGQQVNVNLAYSTDARNLSTVDLSIVASYQGTYSISGGGLEVIFAVSSKGVISGCASSILVVCSGQVAAGGALTIIGNDKIIDTEATLTGRIDASGNITGSFRSNSVSDGEAIGFFAGKLIATPAPSVSVLTDISISPDLHR
jgi:hypothetical protein